MVRGKPILGLHLTLLAFLLLSAWLAAPAHAAIPFERCEEVGAEDWECATHTVPLDWSGKTPGTIDLEVRRYRPPGSPDPSAKLPFVALGGGPGESATNIADLFSRALAPALADYQLIVYDQRGTGLSGPLYCPALKDEELEGDDSDPYDVNRREAARCAGSLGAKRAFYTSLDSARDIDSIRQALDAPRVGISGISYGTYVAAVFAQQYPARTDRIVLDSVVPPTGLPAFGLDTFEAIPRVLHEQCEGGRCAGVTPAPVGDLRRIISQARAPELELILFRSLFNGDLNSPLRGGQPAAFRSKVKGDTAPFERFYSLALGFDEAAGAGGSGEDELQQQLREFSSALNITTRCTDLTPPWPRSTPPGAERNRLFRNALAAVPRDSYFPFGRPAVSGNTTAGNCLRWPLTNSAPPPEHPPFPDVPTLILNGTADIRTPAENAIEAARDFAPDAGLVLVEGYGHSLLVNVECTEAAVASFFAGQPIGDPCAGTDEWAEIEPLPPRTLRQVRPLSGSRGKRGRTLAAAIATVEDARWVTRVKRASGFSKFTTGGLRGGRLNGDGKRKRARLALKRLTYVRGVRLGGKLKLSLEDGSVAGRVRVRGKKAARGRLKFRPNGNVVGRLGGKRVRYRAGR